MRSETEVLTRSEVLTRQHLMSVVIESQVLPSNNHVLFVYIYRGKISLSEIRPENAEVLTCQHVNTSEGEHMFAIHCRRCDLWYEQIAYQHHLGHDCQYGIWPMLACDKHGLDCDYLNAVWRYDNTKPGEPGSSWRRKQRDCAPIFQVDVSPLIVDPTTGEIPSPPGVYLKHHQPDRHQALRHAIAAEETSDA